MVEPPLRDSVPITHARDKEAWKLECSLLTKMVPLFAKENGHTFFSQHFFLCG